MAKIKTDGKKSISIIPQNFWGFVVDISGSLHCRRYHTDSFITAMQKDHQLHDEKALLAG
jgi:hypothetical protein